MVKAGLFLAVAMTIAAPAHAYWSSCVSDLGAGGIVQNPPSIFSKCKSYQSETDYRLSELGKAGIGFFLSRLPLLP